MRAAALLGAIIMSCVLSSTFAMTVAAAPRRTLVPLADDQLALGFDFGTSGVRCTVVDAKGAIVMSPSGYEWGERERCQDVSDWVAALDAQMQAIPSETRARVQRIAVSGTSSSMLLVNTATGKPSADRGAPRMYNFSVKKQAAAGSGEVSATREWRP